MQVQTDTLSSADPLTDLKRLFSNKKLSYSMMKFCSKQNQWKIYRYVRLRKIKKYHFVVRLIHIDKTIFMSKYQQRQQSK